MKIIRCRIEHIPQVVDIFCKAFSSSITFFTPITPKIKEAITDVFVLLLHCFRESFFIAVDKLGRVQGYIIVTDNIKRLWLETLRSGFLFKILFKWIFQKYGITPVTALKVVLNKMCFIIFETTTGGGGQILSVAVNPKEQGRGIGKKMVAAGINYLKSLGLKTVKLEVRPNNLAALKLYSKHGFRQIGKTRDLQGEWLIMSAELNKLKL